DYYCWLYYSGAGLF
nr:immunoglobulin light chain junction region [Macaca mulatta]